MLRWKSIIYCAYDGYLLLFPWGLRRSLSLLYLLPLKDKPFWESFGIAERFPGGAVVKNPLASTDGVSTPGLGRSSGGGNGNPLQYSCLENSMVRGAWQATVHRVTKSQTWLNTHTHTHTHTHIPRRTVRYKGLKAPLTVLLILGICIPALLLT